MSGKNLLNKFNKMKNKYHFIENVTGTGLLLAIHLNEEIPVSKIEKNIRVRGLNVISGGKNALRFTPWFLISNEEIDLICEILENEFDNW